MTPITEELLKQNGFIVKAIHVTQPLRDVYYVDDSGRVTFYQGSNYYGRDWTIHVDNEDMESIGSLDVQYVEQANALLDLLDMQEFKLKFTNNQKEYYGG